VIEFANWFTAMVAVVVEARNEDAPEVLLKLSSNHHIKEITGCR
jgi:hypothetical protein